MSETPEALQYWMRSLSDSTAIPGNDTWGLAYHLAYCVQELQRQIDQITGYAPPAPTRKTLAEQSAELADLRSKIDDLKGQTV